MTKKIARSGDHDAGLPDFMFDLKSAGTLSPESRSTPGGSVLDHGSTVCARPDPLLLPNETIALEIRFLISSVFAIESTSLSKRTFDSMRNLTISM